MNATNSFRDLWRVDSIESKMEVTLSGVQGEFHLLNCEWEEVEALLLSGSTDFSFECGFSALDEEEEHYNCEVLTKWTFADDTWTVTVSDLPKQTIIPVLDSGVDKAFFDSMQKLISSVGEDEKTFFSAVKQVNHLVDEMSVD